MIDGFTFANLSPLIVFPNLPFCETVLWGRREPLPPCASSSSLEKSKRDNGALSCFPLPHQRGERFTASTSGAVKLLRPASERKSAKTLSFKPSRRPRPVGTLPSRGLFTFLFLFPPRPVISPRQAAMAVAFPGFGSCAFSGSEGGGFGRDDGGGLCLSLTGFIIYRAL